MTFPVLGQLRDVVCHLAGLVLPAALEDLRHLAAEVLELGYDHLVLKHLAEEHDVLSDEPENWDGDRWRHWDKILRNAKLT